MTLPRLVVGLWLSQLGCGTSGSETPKTPETAAVTVAAPVAKVTTVRVHGPMPVITAEQKVSRALPDILACWKDSAAPPCGNISVTTGGDRHGNRTGSVSGTVQPASARLCVQAIIRGIRPPTPELSPPGAGLTVEMILAPSLEALQSCGAGVAE